MKPAVRVDQAPSGRGAPPSSSFAHSTIEPVPNDTYGHFATEVRTVLERSKVTAIVSTFGAERLLRGCLDDLEAQTIADRLEIVVINSGSGQNEHDIVTQYMQRYDNIVYVRTPWRESLYAAWNRGVLMAGGQYLTSANTDDRHREDAFEIMAQALDNHPGVDLVYGSYLVTSVENETFVRNTATETFTPLEYRHSLLRRGYCFPGPQPMWRRSVHDSFGLFDEDFRSAGDLEFWLRITQRRRAPGGARILPRRRFLRIPEVLGLYLKSPDSVEHSNPGATGEAARALSRYR